MQPSKELDYAATTGAFSKTNGSWLHDSRVSGNSNSVKLNFTASNSWTGMSTSAAPYTQNMGDGTAFNNMPPYLVVNIWKRLT
nr:hypothetical protein [Fusobacterium ulcerans]